jgi:nucleoside-diphosphate-sugar epimerase
VNGEIEEMRHVTIEEDVRRITDQDLPWSEFEDRAILITGANGFLPAYMVETILYLNEKRFAKPAKVIALVRNRARAEARFADYANRDDLQLLVQDVCTPVKLVEDVPWIVHAASQASPKYYGSDPAGTLSANVLGTYHLLELAREKKTRGFLFFSSGEVYGEVDQTRVPTREEQYGYVDPVDVRSCYAESKRLGETMCVAWHHQFGVPTKIVRPFHTYGPGMSLTDGRSFADFVADIVAGQDIVLKSDGSAVRAYCYLADAVAGFFTVLFKGAPGEAYNIGDEKGETSVGDLAQTLARVFAYRNLRVVCREAAPPPGYLKSPISRSCPDTSKARRLGWRPTTSIPEGFTRTVRSFT